MTNKIRGGAFRLTGLILGIVGAYTLSLHDALPRIGRASCRERV